MELMLDYSNYLAICKNNVVIKNQIKDLHSPDSAIIAGVLRGEEVLIPDGNFFSLQWMIKRSFSHFLKAKYMFGKKSFN